VSGQDNLAAYGDAEGDQAERYARTREFMELVRRLWTEEGVAFRAGTSRSMGRR
jgi:alkanesulfonate monooxygenase